MMEALVALLIAVLLVFVFSVGWVGKVIAIGGLGFFFYTCILVTQYLFGKIRR